MKETLQQHNALLIRSREPLDRNVFPVFTKGPRKGQTNCKKEPRRFIDRWYLVEFLDKVVAEEGKVFLHDGTFSVLDDTTTKTKPTVDERIYCGSKYRSPEPDKAVGTYIYFDGLCVGTIWVQIDEEIPLSFCEACLIPIINGLSGWTKEVGCYNWQGNALAEYC